VPLPARRQRGPGGDPLSELPRSARRVEAALAERGLGGRVRALPDSTRTAPEAAAAIGVEVGQIVKSLLFAGASGATVLVLAAGDNRVDEKKVAALVGEKVAMADPETVRARTGFAIGGVPPVAHSEPSPVLIDATFRRFGEVWAAAGTPLTVFPLSPDELVEISGGSEAEVIR
jgi:prolyl-tRNA editing enzyme YbaK/EbsC (Cys-tRNA(Pro) deacylase)